MMKSQRVLAREVVRRKLKLGDAVESVAQPIAKGIDKLLGTNIKECGGCKRRKEWLNGLTASPSSNVRDFNDTDESVSSSK